MAAPDTTWCLVDRNGTHYKLPRSTIYLGREDCDITLKVSVIYLCPLNGILLLAYPPQISYLEKKFLNSPGYPNAFLHTRGAPR